jgi:glycogen debranching enzyme
VANEDSQKTRARERIPLKAISSVARSHEPVVAKHGSLYLLCTETGDVLPGTDQGLYFHDMRYLSEQTLRLNGEAVVSLLADASAGDTAVFELTNLDIRDKSGDVRLHKEGLRIRRKRRLADDYTEELVVHNYAPTVGEFDITLRFDADFADMFVVRGMHPGKRGRVHQPSWHGLVLTFRYDGADHHTRTATLRFNHSPTARHGTELTYHLKLKSRDEWSLTLRCQVQDEGDDQLQSRPARLEHVSFAERLIAPESTLGSVAAVETSDDLFNQILSRSFRDLQMLSMRERYDTFFAAGVPWYVALFGRDSLITSIETVAIEPEVSANTLRVLAGHQGTRVDDWRDEQPGKILHELRVDELAQLGEIPQTPYYGTVDATPLFLVLLGIHSRWTGSLDLFRALRDNVRAALDWLERFGDSDGDGFIDYKSRSSSGAQNQGWKDSGNGIVMEDGRLAEPPIALPEVQGYVYRAWRFAATLFELDGDPQTALHLREQASRLYDSFNREFWLPDRSYYAFCRQADGTFSKSIASNAAHALWTGIVDPHHSRAVVERALQPDMFSGWGIRTLSSEDVSYNPLEYQLGSVWPHDNALIFAGMRRYGFVEEANRCFSAMVQAASQFEHFRLPELFAGHDRGAASRPVRYPVAASPQAWAAGSMPFMLTSALGLCPDGFNRRLRIRRPCLPSWLDWVNVRHLRVADSEVDLNYRRLDEGTVVSVTRKSGRADVRVEL